MLKLDMSEFKPKKFAVILTILLAVAIGVVFVSLQWHADLERFPQDSWWTLFFLLQVDHG